MGRHVGSRRHDRDERACAPVGFTETKGHGTTTQGYVTSRRAPASTSAATCRAGEFAAAIIPGTADGTAVARPQTASDADRHSNVAAGSGGGVPARASRSLAPDHLLGNLLCCHDSRVALHRCLIRRSANWRMMLTLSDSTLPEMNGPRRTAPGSSCADDTGWGSRYIASS